MLKPLLQQHFHIILALVVFLRGRVIIVLITQLILREENSLLNWQICLREEGYKAIIDPPLPAKQIAFIGGLGKFGKNSLIYSSKFGSYITLHIILTDAEITYDNIESGRLTDCGKCRLCMDACPMQAITEEGVVIAKQMHALLYVNIRDNTH